MIKLTEDISMIADEHCYIVGKPRQRVGRPIEIKDPKYYSTVAQAARGALELTMRRAVADESVTTLRDFIRKQEAVKADLEKLLAPLDV